MSQPILDPNAQRNMIPDKSPAPSWWYKALREMAIFAISLAIVLGLLGFAGWKVYNLVLAPVAPGSEEIIEVEIPTGASTAKIANILKEKGLVRSATVFKYYVDFSDNASKMKAGIYALKPSMSIREIMAEIVSGKAMIDTKTFTIIPGLTVEGIADSLVKQNIITDKAQFLQLANSDQFDNYIFISSLQNVDKRKYKLEGYLYPDTYRIRSNASEKEIMEKMLDQFEKVFSQEYKDRAEELNMTIDQVVTLASIIEKEATAKDFDKVSAVFHNRLKNDMPLQANATLSYIKGQPVLFAVQKDIDIDSPYNTYKYKGLPVGPIANPSGAAIKAALYPDSTFLDQYYYFVVTDPDSRSLVYSKTLQEHNKVSAQYREVWLEWQRQHTSDTK